MSDRPLYGCIEAGGTKFVLGVIADKDSILSTQVIPTRAPEDTLHAALAYFTEAAGRLGAFTAFGIASFGPLALDRSSPNWGHVTATPKPGWNNADLAGPFAVAFHCPIGFDTDVNGAALAEHLWGAAAGADVAIYVTVGTGIGGGAVIEGRPVHGLQHPEMGHMLPRRHPADRAFAGSCPFHGDCLEGLASGTAIRARWGCSLSDLPADHAGHEIVAHYLAQLVIAQQAMLSPRRIILGGGVMATMGLIERVRAETIRLSGGYFALEPIDRLIQPPALGDQAGLLGALALAQAAAR